MTLLSPTGDFVPERLMIVDANNMFMRVLKMAHTGIALSAGDFPTAPLLFFINTMARHIRAWNPDSVVACWDGGKSARRLKLSPAYKAKRKPNTGAEDGQFEMAWLFCGLAGIQQVKVKDVEADDLIAGYSRARAQQITIVSDDHDLRQLVSHKVSLSAVSMTTNSVVRYWVPATVREKYDMNPRHLPYLQALTGDPGDGVRGVPGIGIKRGTRLLQSFSYDWPALLASLTPDNAAEARLALKLVDLTTPDADSNAELIGLPEPEPFTPLAEGMPNWSYMCDFLSTLQMQGVIERLQAGKLWSSGPVQSQGTAINVGITSS